MKQIKLFGFTLKNLGILYLINVILLFPVTLGKLYLPERVVQELLMYFGMLGNFIISLFVLCLMSKKDLKKVKK